MRQAARVRWFREEVREARLRWSEGGTEEDARRLEEDVGGELKRGDECRGEGLMELVGDDTCVMCFLIG